MAPASQVKRLVDKGMKLEDIARADRAMASYFDRQIHLEANIRYCEEVCELRGNCHFPVIGAGSHTAEVMVVGDTPNKMETKFGHAGYQSDYTLYLMMFFYKLGLDTEDVFWTHAVKCPTQAHYDSSSAPLKMKMRYIKNCHRHLEGQIQVVQPSVIVALGSTAMSSLAGEPIRIEEAIGNEFTYGEDDIPVIAIHHPNTFLQESEEAVRKKTNQTWKQLKRIGDLM